MISRRGFLGGASAFSASNLVIPSLKMGAETPAPRPEPGLEDGRSSLGSMLECANSAIQISVVGTESVLWSLKYRDSGRNFRFAPPKFPVSEGSVDAVLHEMHKDRTPVKLRNGVTEFSFAGTLDGHPSLNLRMIFQLATDSALVRFRYVLESKDEKGFSFNPQSGPLIYAGLSLATLTRVTEVQLSNWSALLHSDTLGVREIQERWFQNHAGLAGPILLGVTEGGDAFLFAYEHGSQMPNTFLRYDLKPNRSAELVGVKGNYVAGERKHSFETVWMEASVGNAGVEGLAREFRKFVLTSMDADGNSRYPYLFYNTWSFQERDKWWYHKEYLSSYNNEKLLAEIDVANRLGLEIFVMDTGWYQKTGDWEPDPTRFPDRLKTVKARLDGYGMKLGLWFNPTMAAVSSKVLAVHRGDICAWMGKTSLPGDIWGSEASYPMCLVSDYSNAYADAVIRVARETGARYFIWDAVAQYGCDSPDHWHGTSANSQEERSESYAFQLPLQMVRIVEKVRSVFPEIVFDFDITENGRAVGLGFLSAGRFFLANNGPYLADYDLPHKAGAQNDNIFFFPGPARTWICRKPLNYDQWIPSNLFLTHYFPDDPMESQLVNMATLVLGQNGIWGNLSMVSEPGIEWISQLLRRYKDVRQDVMDSYPVVRGSVSSSYETHEKVNESNGRGVVVLFSTTPGRMVYVTEHTPARQIWSTDGTKVSFDRHGHAVIESQMEAGAAIVFFGVRE
ncbi:MAG: alpha-galactosidase [Terracidiphilus sp.]